MGTHRFHPRRYHNTLGSHEPVLRVRAGDAVITTTVDARGFDARGEQVAARGNPQTGPFYIEDAEPGDAYGAGTAFNPAYAVACKIAREVLGRVGSRR